MTARALTLIQPPVWQSFEVPPSPPDPLYRFPHEYSAHIHFLRRVPAPLGARMWNSDSMTVLTALCGNSVLCGARRYTGICPFLTGVHSERASWDAHTAG